MVLNEEHQPKKKNKAKKIPLRGLGVAQLEKLRVEEQQKNHNNIQFSSSPSNIPSPSPFTLSVPPRDQSPLFRSCFSSSSSSSSLSQNIDFFQSDKLHLLKNSPIQMVNRASLLPSLSGDNLQIELPSLQSYTHSSWSDQERIAGINTQWHAHPEIMSFPYKSPHLSSPLFNPNESAYMDGKVPFRFEYKSPGFSKEASLNSGPHPVDWKKSEVLMKKHQRENSDPSDNKFQALGSSSTQPVSRIKLPMNIPPTQRHEKHEFSILSSQFTDSSRQPFYSFLPVGPIDQKIDEKEQRSEAKDDVDTRLKL